MSAMKKTGYLATATALFLLLASVLVTGCGSSENDGQEGSAGTPIDAGLPALTLIAPETTGAGEVPAFEWEAVDGAARYRLVVLGGSGEPLWSWNGAETKVNLGGLPGERPEGVSGPVIAADSTWSVVAFDAEGNALAASNLRPVSP